MRRLDANRPSAKAAGDPLRGRPVFRQRVFGTAKPTVSSEVATGTALWYRGGVPPGPI